MADIIRVEGTKKDDNFAALVAGGARIAETRISAGCFHFEGYR